jgi:hypothetical protein
VSCPIINAYVGEVRILLKSDLIGLSNTTFVDLAGTLYEEENEQWRDMEQALDQVSSDPARVRLRAFYCVDALRQLLCQDMLKTGLKVFQHASEYYRPIPHSWSGLCDVLEFVEVSKKDAISYRFEQRALGNDRQFTEFALAKVSALDALGAMARVLRPELRDPIKHISLVGVQFAHGLRDLTASLSTYILHCRRLMGITEENMWPVIVGELPKGANGSR